MIVDTQPQSPHDGRPMTRQQRTCPGCYRPIKECECEDWISCPRVWMICALVGLITLLSVGASASPLCDRAIFGDWGRTSTPSPKFAQIACQGVEKAAEGYGVPPCLAVAVSSVESNFRPFVCSSSNACGVMQVKQHYHCRSILGWRACLSSRQLIRAGVRHLADLLRNHDERTAVRAYNAGVRGATRLDRGHGYAQTVARVEGRICGGI